VQLRGEISLRKTNPQLVFETLASEWKEQVSGSSFVAEKTSHPAYQKIIEMGQVVVPFLLRELEQKPTHWFEALKAITGANPVQPEQRGRTKQMAQAWLQWGREQGYEW
jgi:ribosomal protein L5